jgi:hypothetical protein
MKKKGGIARRIRECLSRGSFHGFMNEVKSQLRAFCACGEKEHNEKSDRIHPFRSVPFGQWMLKQEMGEVFGKAERQREINTLTDVRLFAYPHPSTPTPSGRRALFFLSLSLSLYTTTLT